MYLLTILKAHFLTQKRLLLLEGKSGTHEEALCEPVLPKPLGISPKITLWIIFLPKREERTFAPTYLSICNQPPAQNEGCRAAGSSVLSFHFQMPQHFFALQKIKPRVPLGLGQQCHQPRPSETSWLLLTGGSGGIWFPESSPSAVGTGEDPSSLPINKRPADWASKGIAIESQNMLQVYTSHFLFH